jgi:hypothetical protein
MAIKRVLVIHVACAGQLRAAGHCAQFCAHPRSE